MQDYAYDAVLPLQVGTNLMNVEQNIHVKRIEIHKAAQRTYTYTLMKLDKNHAFVAQGLIVGTKSLRAKGDTDTLETV